jgi:hypothetical protein
MSKPNSVVCALPTCMHVVPLTTYEHKLALHPGTYCSSQCDNAAFDLMRKGKKFAKNSQPIVAVEQEPEKQDEEIKVSMPHSHADDFGTSGVIRRFCDLSSCRKPVTLCWTDKLGEFCSNECLLEAKKKEKEHMAKKATVEDPEEVETEKTKTEETEDDSPVTSGKASKKATKKAVTKKGAKKGPVAVAKKAAGSGLPAPRFSNEQVITVKSADHTLKGNRGAVLDLFKSGMSVEKYKASLAKKDLGGMAGWALKTGVELGMITVK